MLRNNHDLMIEQDIGSETHWTVIRLRDSNENTNTGTLEGSWRITNQSYNDKEPYFTSSSKEYWYWKWKGPHAGTLEIGVKMGRASYREDEKEVFQVLISLDRVRRTADSRWEVDGVIKRGSGELSYKVGTGTLTYNVGSDFVKGGIIWSVTRYEH